MTSTADSSKLFQPIQVGNLGLQHRVVLAPLTRLRANDRHIPLPAVSKYYSQRSGQPGTLLISEATFLAQRAGGYHNAPGIWTDEQIVAWKKITDEVHANGSFIFLQLWALGRAADPSVLESESLPFVSASDIPLTSQTVPPRPLSTEEITEYVELYAKAASNAVHKAGFDGVELHAANGYLLDQFIQDVSNKRTDRYGGSPQNRARFPLEVVEAVTKEIGEERTGIRFSPWSSFQDMGETDPVPVFSYLTTQIRDLYPSFAYLHLIEPRIAGHIEVATEAHASNDFLLKIWGSRPVILAGGYTRAQAMDAAEKSDNSMVAFGRHFIANPDLPRRLQENIPLNPYDRKTFLMPGDDTGRGYTDQPFAPFVTPRL